MSYGNGQVDGVIQYNELSRSEACRFFDGLKSRNCPHFQLANQDSSCGDGLLGADEECECVDRSQSCGQCQKCKVASSSVQCSSSQFAFRNGGLSKKTYVVKPELLSDKRCCKSNKLTGPKTLCGPGLRDACGPHGECIKTCTRWILPDNQNCGFDDNGCTLGCKHENKCRFDLIGRNAPIGRMPDGTACVSSGKKRGVCQQGACNA
jgi:hypothetical protein